MPTLPRPNLRWRIALQKYQRNRATPHRDSVCNAPFTNLYFAVDGQVASCWLHFAGPPPRWSPERSIADIWKGPELERLRRNLTHSRFTGACKTCKHDISTGNRPLAAAYDNDAQIGEWPTMVELELSNLCNLECVMCSGRLSSRIRKYRDHLPPIESPYDDSFVDQIGELAPHLHELRFNGGEPLLQPIVYKIAAKVAEVHPELKITIATNGTIMNDKVRRLLDQNNIHVNLSLDSLVPERYEGIRINAEFDKVMEHFEIFRTYCADNDRVLCIMVNPMRMNWEEMPHYVWWCNERDVHMWFNTIRYPEDLALHNLSAGELSTIHDTLAAAPLPPPPDGPAGAVQRHNLHLFDRFVHHQVATWRDEAKAGPPVLAGVPVELRSKRVPS